MVIFEHQRVFVAGHNTSVYDLASPIPRWKNPKPIHIIYAIVAAVFVIIVLAYIALDCYNLKNYYYGLYRADSRLGTAYYAIYLVILIVAVIAMIICLVQMNSRHVASGVSPSQPNTTSAC